MVHIPITCWLRRQVFLVVHNYVASYTPMWGALQLGKDPGRCDPNPPTNGKMWEVYESLIWIEVLVLYWRPLKSQAPLEGARLCHAVRYDLHITSDAQLAPWRRKPKYGFQNIMLFGWTLFGWVSRRISSYQWGNIWPRMAKKNQMPGI